jgi:hypothetical protein
MTGCDPGAAPAVMQTTSRPSPARVAKPTNYRASLGKESTMSGLRNLACGAALALIAVFAIAPHAGYTISSTPVMVVNPVTVGNPDDPAAFAKAQNIQHPFSMQFECSFNFSIFCEADPTNPPRVPATQRWAVESLSYRCMTARSEFLIDAGITTMTGLAAHFLPFVSTPIVSNVLNGNVTNVALNLRFYEEPGAPISFTFLASDITTGQCNITISGQAIDVS